MPQLSLDIPHGLTQEEAARRLKEKIAAAMAEHGDRLSDVHTEWRDQTFSFSGRALGMSVSGTVTVEPHQVRVSASLPLAAMLFKGAIEARIRTELTELLAPA